MKASDQCMVVGYVVIAPHMNPILASAFALVAFAVSIVLRGFGK